MQILITLGWLLVFCGAVAGLLLEPTAGWFKAATALHPYLMGFGKFVLLGTMGELLGGRIATGRWRLGGIRLGQRALVWGAIGVMLALVIPLFSTGVDALLGRGMLPGAGLALAPALWKSVLMNLLFGFEMMVFHRFTDTLVSRGRLFSAWPAVEVFRSIDWRNMLRVVGLAVLWFWIPAHTVTFLLPEIYRVAAAALLGIALGLIMGFASKKAKAQRE
ncbi:MAG: hypothetical protein JXP48_05230 [Acidobacteria bacterium]|nr:hypothetical protein [Acidobacteriota bacterium]